MKLTAKLAYSQIKKTRSRTLWTLAGIVLSTTMITAVFGFAASGNAMLTNYIGDNAYYMSMYNTTLYGISAVLISIIMAASVIVISNAFRVSAGERIAQFGILKSVGATRKQITETVLFESIYLCLIGIPVGIVLGLVVDLAGMQIANYYLVGLNRLSEVKLTLSFVFAWQAIILSIIVAFATALLSAWLPARKAAKIPAIEAIRGVGEAKITSKRIRKNSLSGKLFGFEGALASKSLKRSKRNFRATVTSLTVSIILLIIAGDFGTQINKTVDLFYPGIDTNVVGEFYAFSHVLHSGDGEAVESVGYRIDSNHANDITAKLREFENTDVLGVGMDDSHSAFISDDMLTPKMREVMASVGYGPDNPINSPVNLVAVDAENYAMLCGKAGAPPGSNILVNRITWYYDSGREVFTPYIFAGQTLQLTNYNGETVFDLPLHGELAEHDVLGGISRVTGTVTVIVPHIDARNYMWCANAGDAAGFAEYAEHVLNDMITLDESLGRLIVLNIEELTDATRGMANLVMTFIYGFVCLLTLIGLTNVISTISTNVRSRSREFAILRSVGMTQGGMKRMLNLESLLCSAKSLVYGLPIGVAGSFLVYQALDLPVEFSYSLPWVQIIQCIVGVFVITWVVMRYSASRLQGGSIIETIRAN